MPEIANRLSHFSRGRPVEAHFEDQDFVLALDYEVSFDSTSNTFWALFRRGGCFEGAYQCIERWIESKAEQLDGLQTAPDNALDLRKDMHYWVFERVYEQFRQDVQMGIASAIDQIERIRPNEGVPGEVTVEARLGRLRAVPLIFALADEEVRRGVLSPQTVGLLKAIGLDPAEKHG